MSPPSLGMIVSSAPNAAIWVSLSSLKASEVTMCSRYPFAAQTRASEAPVLPPVYSTTAWPGGSLPSSSARPIIACAIRSFMLPVGFWPSVFTRILAQPGGTTRRSSTSEVLPIAASTLALTFITQHPLQGRRSWNSIVAARCQADPVQDLNQAPPARAPTMAR